MKLTPSGCIRAIFVATLAFLTFGSGNTLANDNLNHSIYFHGSSSSRSLLAEKRIWQMINEERSKDGSGSLVWDARLANVARSHSDKMASEDFFGHKDKNGKNLVDRMRAINLTNWSGVAENLYFCKGFDDPTTAAVMGWLKSSGHKSNLLNKSWKSTGIGIATSSDGKVYVTQVFMK